MYISLLHSLIYQPRVRSGGYVVHNAASERYSRRGLGGQARSCLWRLIRHTTILVCDSVNRSQREGCPLQSLAWDPP